ncbi:PKD domain-containing protein [Reichenbachiella versicolor]|uniref:PKD domain-containing protein n=1 Tax=Reichenbachiella versicolor TaxID=1821036 RepID=UPI0013A53E43|nr:PKD domain-containing protein [Reichenbachiella versicolor]
MRLHQQLRIGVRSIVRWAALLCIPLLAGWTFKHLALVPDGTAGPELQKQTWPAGTFLSHFPEGDRINTYHRNYLMISGQAGTGIWDISNPTDPTRLKFSEKANNGHRWYKIGDLFWREYSVPEVSGTPYRYLDLSNMLDHKPITSSDVLYTVLDGNYRYDKLETFPHTIESGTVYDMRSGATLGDIPVSIGKPDIVVRLGNYVFFVPQTGDLSVFDLGDPMNVKFLGSFGSDIPHEQYSTGIQLWRNYLIYMSGNAGDNLVAFDISDPSNVTHGFNISSDDITLGRYMIFQDEFGFTGRFDRGVKYNFEEMRVEQEFFPPSTDETLQLLDNQWMPIGNIVVASGDGKTSIFSHQDGLDLKPPTVGFHFPKSGDINQPVTTTLGFVINEVLDDLTLNDANIQVSPLGGSPIEADVSSTSYQVINYAPRQPLLPNTTYEVKFVEGGIKDAVGNGMEEYIYYFTTGGDSSNQSPIVSGITSTTSFPALVGNQLSFSANATDPDGNALSYRWDFGDGSPKTAWGGASVNHTYLQDGNFKIQVQISDNNGGFSVDTKSVSIVNSIPVAKPSQSSPIAIDAANRIVWVVNPDNNSVTMLDADTHAKIKEIPVAQDPVSVAIDAEGEAWVACRDADQIDILSTAGVFVKSIPLSRGASPYGVVFDHNGVEGYLSEFGAGLVTKLDGSTNTIGSSLTLGNGPRALALSGDGTQLLVTQLISPDSGGNVWEVNTSNFSLKASITLPIDDTTIDNGNQARGIPNYITGVSIHPYNNTAWTVGKKDNILRGLARDGQAMTFDNSVRTAISKLDLNTATETVTERMDIDNHGQPSAAMFTPTGNYLFVTMQGNNHLIAIDPKKGLELFTEEVGLAPQGLIIDPVTQKIFVKNFMDRTVTIFDAQSMLETGTVGISKLATVSTVGSELLTSQVLTGKQIFYNAADQRMGTDGYISCASCHLDGAEDGRVWDFTDRGEGLRNTISLRGRAGTAHGRVHWSANFDEIQDFENDIRFHFNGSGFLSNADFIEGTTSLTLGDPKAGKSVDLDALAAYVESLSDFDKSPYKNNDGSMTAAALSGKTLFQTLNCNSCHSGDAFTDSPTGRVHDVGTITSTSGLRMGKTLPGLDVPTLKSIWNTPPYLHDGSAATLLEVLTSSNATEGHSDAQSLTQSQLNDLVAYLSQLDGDDQSVSNDFTLEMSSPVDGTKLTKSAPVELAVNTSITGVTKIEYFIDNELVSSATAAPFTSTWEPVIWKQYGLSAKVYYNNGKTASVTPEINVQFKEAIDVMFIVGDKDLSRDDQRVKSRMEQLYGFNMHVWDDEDASSPAKTNPYDLVLVSVTVDPHVLGSDIESSVVPIMTWDPYIYNRVRLTAPGGTGDNGFTSEGYQTITINQPTHPMAAGLGASAELYSIVQKLPYGAPKEDAIVIASAGTQPIIFGYESGSSAVSRRVAFPLRDQFMHLLTDDGWKLFDAAVLWTLHGGDAQTPIASRADIYFDSPADGVLVNTPFDVSFVTENWDLFSGLYKLRFRIDGSDRGLITSEGSFSTGAGLSEGIHTLTLQMERSNHFPMDLTDTLTVIVTDDPLPTGPTVSFKNPFDGSLLGPDFDIEFSTFDWDIQPGGKHVKCYLDDVLLTSAFDFSPIPVTGQADGQHEIKLALADASGTLTGPEASITVTVDQAVANLPDSPFKVEYYNNSSSPLGAEIKPVIRLVNDSSAAIPYSDFAVRYWYTPEHSGGLKFNADYSAISGVSGTSGVTTDGEHYIEIAFANSASLSANSKSGSVQMRLHHAGYQSQDQTNDFSYDRGKSSFKPHIQTTLYYQGQLVWGLEPGNSTPVNLKPQIVISTTALTGDAPLQVSFDASLSSDPDGTISSYAWDFGDGTTASTAQTSNSYDVPGSYQVVLTVTDDQGATTTKTLTVTATDPLVNNLPTARITTSVTTGIIPLDVSFDASASSDPDGDALTYTWDFGDGTSGTGALVNHTYDLAGIYDVILTVDDGNGGVDTETVQIQSSDTPINSNPIAAFVPSVTAGTVPLTVSFDASSSSDPDGDALTYAWDFGDNTTGTGVTVSHTFTTLGSYTVVLNVSDGNGGTDAITMVITAEDNVSPGDCNFGTPISTALPSIQNIAYNHIHVLGAGGPDLSNVTNFTINWNQANNGLHQLSMSTNNGQPSWWNNLAASATHTFGSSSPDITLSGTGFVGLDGAYYVNVVGGDFVMVSKTGGFTLYFTNSTTAPSCSSNARQVQIEPLKDESILIYPSITSHHLFIEAEDLEHATYQLFDATGHKYNVALRSENGRQVINVNSLSSGVYFIRLKRGEQVLLFRFIKT